MTTTLETNLKRRAAVWAGQLTKMAKALAPNHVKSAISSHVETKEDSTYIIRITADRKIAPDARAQEYGSGIHARRGPKTTYEIHPKRKKLLAFEWDALDEVLAWEGLDGIKSAMQYSGKFVKVIGIGENGSPIYLFRYVDHPGIRAANNEKGYIAPAVNELRKKARAELDKEVRDAIMGDLRRSFGKK